MDSLYNCLWSIRAWTNNLGDRDRPLACTSPTKSENNRVDASLHEPFSPMSGEERRKVLSESKFHRTLSSPVMSGLILTNINYINVEDFCWPPNEEFSSTWILFVYHLETLKFKSTGTLV